jgi:hypothetical protein
MQRKQQVGECWVCVIFFACVCVWVRQIRRLRLTIPSPFFGRFFAIFSGFCSGRFPRGVLGGAGMPPPWLREAFDIGR